MYHPYQIRLTQPEWDTFIQRLTRSDDSRQRRINALFNSINQDISVSHESNRVVIHSDLLDEEAILASLHSAKPDNQTVGSTSYGYRISCVSHIDEQDDYQAIASFAEYDGYHELLGAAQLATSTYEIRVVDGTLAAA